MRIVIDNSIILDALLGRQPYNKAAEQILLHCANAHEGCLNANSLTAIFYILRKAMDAKAAKESVKTLVDLFAILSVSEDECVNALTLPIDDFEDALVAACAMKAEADYIVTRDKQLLLMPSPVTIVSPEKILDILESNHRL